LVLLEVSILNDISEPFHLWL